MALGCGGGGGEGSGPPQALTLESLTVSGLSGGAIPFAGTGGGALVTVRGKAFLPGIRVVFDNTDAPTVNHISDTELRVRTPAHPQGVVPVSLFSPSGESTTVPNAFEFISPPLVITVLANDGPTQGEPRAAIAGGATFTITGSNFKFGAEVYVNGSPVTEAYLGPTTMSFVDKGNTTEASVDVRVLNPEGLDSTLVAGLAYTAEFSLASQTGSLTIRQATHLLRRMGFGATQVEINAAIGAGTAATISALLSYTNDDTVEQEALTFYGANQPPAASIGNATGQYWWIHLLRHNSNAFQERLAFFLHDHFATSGRDMSSAVRWALYNQINLFRRFSLATDQTLGNGDPGLGYDWKQFCIEIAKDRSMLDWLDGRLSRVGRPNENFARELWELFMLGEGEGYDEADIQEAARAFTGFVWYFPSGQPYLDFTYVPSFHDAGEKDILGEKGRFGYDDITPFWNAHTGTADPTQATDPADTDGGVVALTLRARPTEASRFICRKLATHFLYDEPHDVVVNELAADLVAANWNLKPVLQKLFRSKAMYSSAAIKGKVKSPVEYVIGFLKSADTNLHPTNDFLAAARAQQRMTAIGQVPLDPPDVNGWPVGTAWLGTQTMLERINFVNAAVKELDSFDEHIEPLLPPVGQRSAPQFVDHFANMLDVRISGTTRTQFIAYVNNMLDGSGNSIPYDPTDETHLITKTRGLIYLLAQYYNGHQE
ncbi:MAG: DUF1800 family protein [Planctomycetota bacterium]